MSLIQSRYDLGQDSSVVSAIVGDSTVIECCVSWLLFVAVSRECYCHYCKKVGRDRHVEENVISIR